MTALRYEATKLPGSGASGGRVSLPPSCLETKELTRHFSPDAEERKKWRQKKDAESLADLYLLREKLRAENRPDLLAKIAICRQPLDLRCLDCGDKITISQRCKRKWCPCCARQLAAARSAELDFVVERMRWPLFVTLTMQNVDELRSCDIRKLRRAFGKLRHRRFWKDTVKGGVAAVEVTNIGNGWHPHLHAVVDCPWLAIKTRQPQRTASKGDWEKAIKAAAQELEAHWSKCLGQPSSSVKVKRADRATIAKEVCKYTVKAEDLITEEGEAGTLIDALDGTRLMTTFGTAHGQCVKEIRREAKAAAKLKRAERNDAEEPRCYCGSEDFAPLEVFDAHEARRQKESRR